MILTRSQFDSDPQIATLAPAQQDFLRQQYFNQSIRPTLAGTQPVHQQSMLQAWGVVGPDTSQQYDQSPGFIHNLTAAFNQAQLNSSQATAARAIQTATGQNNAIDAGPQLAPTSWQGIAGATLGTAAGQMADVTNLLPLGIGGAAAHAVEPLAAMGAKEIATQALAAGAKGAISGAVPMAAISAGTNTLANYANGAPLTQGLGQAALSGGLMGGIMGGVHPAMQAVLGHPDVQAGMGSIADRIMGRSPSEPTAPNVPLLGTGDTIYAGGNVPAPPPDAFTDQFGRERIKGHNDVPVTDPSQLLTAGYAFMQSQPNPGMIYKPTGILPAGTREAAFTKQYGTAQDVSPPDYIPMGPGHPPETPPGIAGLLLERVPVNVPPGGFNYRDPEAAFTQQQGERPVTPSPQEVMSTVPQQGALPMIPARMSLAQTTVDPKTFQFKETSDPYGLTDRLKGVNTWDSATAEARPALVYQDANGQHIIADGHQRSGLARRLTDAGQTVPPSPVLVMRATDGWTPETAMRRAALQNIQDGTGSAVDVARLIRSGQFSDHDLASIPPNSANFRDGRELAKLSDNSFSQVASGRVPAAQAAAVGRHLSDPLEQDAVMGMIAKQKPATATEADHVARFAKGMGFDKTVTHTLWGDQMAVDPLIEHGAGILKAAARSVGADKKVLGSLLRNESSVEAIKGNTVNTEATGAAHAESRQIESLLGVEAHRPGIVRDTLKSGAEGVKAGTMTQDDAALRVKNALSMRLAEAKKAGVSWKDLITGEEGSANPLGFIESGFNAAATARVKASIRDYNAKITQLESNAARADAAGNTRFAQAARARAAQLHQEMQPLTDTMSALGERPAAKVNPDTIQASRHVNFEKLNVSPETQDRLTQLIQENRAQMGEAHKTRVTFEQVQKEANRIGGQELEAQLAKMKPGQLLDRAQYKASIDTIKTLNEHAHGLSEQLKDPMLAPEDHQRITTELNQVDKDVHTLLDKVIPTRSEYGRNLAMLRMMGKQSFEAPYWINRAQRIAGGLDGATTTDIQDILRRGAAAQASGDEAGMKQARMDLAKKMAGLSEHGLLDTVTHLWKAGLLTGLRTLEKVTYSHIGLQGMEELAKMPASVIDLAMSAITKNRTVLSPALRLNKVLGSVGHAAIQGGKESLEILKHGMTEQQLSALNIPRELNSKVPVLGPIANAYTRAVFRTHSAVYHPFYTYAYHRGLQSMAEITARQEARGVAGFNIKARTAELMKAPTSEMQAEAAAAGAFATFSEPNAMADAVSRGKQALPNWGKFVANQILPFTHVPANVITRVLDYSVIGGVARVGSIGINRAFSNEALKALTPAEQKTISMAFGRGLVGVPLIMMGYWLGQRGLMTGDYDQKTAALDKASGRQMGSVKIAGQWVPVSELSPLGNMLTMGAELAKNHAGLGNPGAIAAVAGKTVLDQPMLQGVQQIEQLKDDPAKGIGKYAGAMAGSYVPTMVSDIARAGDPADRIVAKNGMDAITQGVQSRIPGLRNSLPSRVDALGQPSTHPSGLNAFNTLAGTPARENTNPAIAELIRMQASDNPADHPTFGAPSNALRLSGKSIPLNAAQQQQLAAQKGQSLSTLLSGMVANPGYEALDDDQRSELFKTLKMDANKAGNGRFIQANRGSLIQQLQAAMR